MGSQQQFCLRWNNHQTNVMSIFEHLYKEEHLVDVTLACDGLTVKAHKVVLSACSPYFQALFVDNPCPHPIVFLKDVQYHELRTVVDFMYRGEVNVSQEQLNAVLETAEALKVRGLAEVTTTEAPPSSSSNNATNGEGDNYALPQAKINTGNGYNEGAQGQSHAHHQSHHHMGGDYHHSHMLSSSSSQHHHAYLHVHPRSLSPGLNSSGGQGGGGGASASPKDPSEGGVGGGLGGGAKRCLSPTAKRRKAKPRKRLPENTIPSDHDDSDALDLSTASPDLCMDTQDNPYDEHLTHIKMEPEEPINDKDYNSNQNKCVRSPVHPTTSGPLSTSASSSLAASALRMPIIPKQLQPLSVSVNCPSATSHMPSTSAVQSSIIHQDIRRLCQYSRQSQQHKPTWTEEDMVQALEAVQSGRLTYALAARKFDIPKATLHYYVILMKAVEAVRSGRMTAEIAAIKYNVRTSILLDCLFGRQSTTTSSTTIPGATAPPLSSSAAPPADSSAPLPPPPLLPPSSTSAAAPAPAAPNLASTSAVADTKSSAYK